uniref:branched-chain amino acid transport system II carrier protein n=1 Tax=Caloramator sp. Dgby_cultured_2 TaxID=3029174 RepID=UPI003158A123
MSYYICWSYSNCRRIFSKLTKNRLTYKSVVIAVTIFSAIISNFGVEKIVKIAVPLLVTVYPVVIVLIILNIFDEFIKNKNAYAVAVYITLIISIIDGLAAIGFKLQDVQNLLYKLPFAISGFGWLIPALIAFLVATLFSGHRIRKNNINWIRSCFA